MVEYAQEYNLDIIAVNATRIIYNEVDRTTSKAILFGGVEHGKIKSGEEYLVHCIINKKFSISVCNRMYKTSLIKHNNMYFKNNILHEDENWTPKIILLAERVGYYNINFYNYVIRSGSITQTNDKRKHIQDLIDTCIELEKIYSNQVKNSENRKILKDYLVKLYINTSTLGEYNGEFYKKIVDKKFLSRNAYFLKTKLELMVFNLNIYLYRYIKIRLT